jgi:ribosome-binding factor A
MKSFDSRGARRSGRAHADARAENGSLFSTKARGRASHKAAQLCRQAMQALSLALADSADDVLRELTVVSVEPAPDVSRLLVSVAPVLAAGRGAGEVSAIDVLTRLNAAARWLRSEVASAITRKRAPELMFVIVAGGEVRT